MNACCAIPHGPLVTCDEIAWAASAPTEAEAFHRTMQVLARLNGGPMSRAELVEHRRRFRAEVHDAAMEQGDR